MPGSGSAESRSKAIANVIAACSLIATAVLGILTYTLSRDRARLEAANSRLEGEKTKLEQAALDLERKKAETAEAKDAPTMDVRYLTTVAFDKLKDFAKVHGYPMQQNSIIKDYPPAKPPAPALVVLEVTNRGGRAADETMLVVEVIPAGARSNISSTYPSDFHQDASVDSSPPPNEQPLALGTMRPGVTCLVPVFRIQHGLTDPAASTLDGVAYIPRHIKFRDSISGKQYDQSVRKMLECPFDISGDITARGP